MRTGLPAKPPPTEMLMADGSLVRVFWRLGDALDHWQTLARLRILDALAGPEPETPADQQRQRDQARIEKAFPEIKP
jgi:hypothetical protein